jgi:general L-amino acid transport system permease protein
VTATLEPPATVVSRTRWVRENLARTPLDVALTLVFGLFLLWAVYRGLRFLLVTADWEIVRRNLRLFMVGQFPADQLWRPWAAAYVLAATLGLCAGVIAAVAATDPRRAVQRTASRRPAASVRSGLRRFWPLVLFVVAMLVLIRTPLPGVLLIGLVGVVVATRALGRRLPGLARWLGVIVASAVLLALQIVVAAGGVGWDDWGGLQLTLFVTVAGIALAFPMGVLAALGRRSSLPAIRIVSVGYIELFRAVPLVAFLFIGQYLMLYAVPTFIDPPSFLIRALVVIALFESAYIAEIVRGGLQSIPVGQLEAAHALGLGPVQTTRRVVLPQALRNVIPAIVGQFISLFKDTSLLAIVGFFEVLDVARSVPSQSDFVGQGLSSITLAFAGFVYWVGSYTMSRESRRLEVQMGVGTR